MVCNNLRYSGLSYRKLFTKLYNTDFIPMVFMDKNRDEDGREFRYTFGYLNEISRDDIAVYIDNKPCSILEMIMALVYRVETHITADSDYGDRVGQWFWNCINSLGLAHMNDNNYDPDYVENVLYIFVNRRYEANGQGGLFTIDDPPEDMSKVEIWKQAMWYLNTIWKENYILWQEKN